MPKKVKRLEWARVSFLSLCPRGATRLPGLYKADDDQLEWSPLIKATDDFEEKGQLTALVYVPDTVDSQGHFATKDAIEKMAHSFMQEGAKLDIRHDRRELKKEQAFVAESFVVQKNDPRFQGIKDHLGKEVDPTGGWGVVIQIDDPALRKAYKEGGWDGVSLWSYHGDYSLKEENEAVMKALEELQQQMEKKEMADLLKEHNKPLEESLTNLNKTLEKFLSKDDNTDPPPEKEEKPKGGPDDGKPVFKGDLTDTKALLKYQQELEIHSLRKQYDFNEPAQVKEYIEKVEELKKSFSESTDDNDDSDDNADDPKVKELEKQLADLKKKASRSKAPKDSKPVENYSNLSKEEQAEFEIGHEIAEIANRQRGYSK